MTGIIGRSETNKQKGTRMISIILKEQRSIGIVAGGAPIAAIKRGHALHHIGSPVIAIVLLSAASLGISDHDTRTLSRKNQRKIEKVKRRFVIAKSITSPRPQQRALNYPTQMIRIL
jgi:hypothetical protein